MPGLVPGIHVLCGGTAKPWMAGTSPAMTERESDAAYSALLTSLIRGSASSIRPR
jgi:hypothetical protein